MARHTPYLGWSRIHIRIVDLPPTVNDFEGFDLRPYQLKRGASYELEYRLAEVLLAWNYAELDRRFRSRRPPDAN